VGGNEGSVENSYATGNVSAGQEAFVGGLIGGVGAGSSVNVTYATGTVTGGQSAWAGGLAGGAEGQSQINNSYATGSVSVGAGKRHRGLYSYAGGLIGATNSPGLFGNSYSTGAVSGGDVDSRVGGSIGGNGGTATDIFWDTTTSGTDIGVGWGSDQGVTGQTIQQLQSGLPAGFDPKIWGEKSNINNGLPYLLAIPPKK
jgi:hypothetical protein